MIRVSGAGKSYGETRALVDVSLSVAPGEVLGLLGPNGAGKTTLVRLLATLLTPDRGRVLVGGHDTATDPAAVRSLIGLAGQFAAVDDKLTGRENLDLVGRLYGLGADERRARAGEVLARVGLVEVGDRLVRTYSGGMRRRLDLAATLVGRPAVLLLDEPTTGVDPGSRAEIWRHIRQLADEGVAVVLTSQHLDEAERLADRIVLLDRGRVIAEGTVDDLKRRVGGDVLEVTVAAEADVDRARLALPGNGDGRALVEVGTRRVTVPTTSGTAGLLSAGRRLEDLGIRLDDLGIRRPSLDEVYFALTGGDGNGDGDGPAPAAAPAEGMEPAPEAAGADAPAEREREPEPEPVPVPARGSRSVSEVAGITGRALLHLARTPQQLFFALVQPVLFIAMLGPVFARLVERWTGGDYPQYLLPGVLVMTVTLAAGGTGVALAEDLHTGVIDRFRSLPMARHALLVGRTLADLCRNTAATLLVVAVGLALGFRFERGLVRAVAAVGLVLLFGYALTWVFAAVGLAVGDVQAATFLGFAPVLPFVFLSGVMVPVDAMGGGLQAFARNQPVNATLEAVRSLIDADGGGGGGGAWVLRSVLWSLAIVAVFAPLATRVYRRSASR